MFNYWKLASVRLFVLGILPAVAGGLLAATGVLWLQESAAFIENLRTAEGRVTRFIAVEPDPAMEVEFHDESGIRFRKELPLAGRDEAELQRMGKVTLVYDVRDPRTAKEGDIRTANRDKLGSAALVAAGLILLLGGLAVLSLESLRIMSIRRLLLCGQLVQTEVRDSNVSPRRSSGRFTYAFRGPDGRWFEGKSPEFGLKEVAKWPVGRGLTIAYDRNDPRKNEPDVFRVTETRRRDRVESA